MSLYFRAPAKPACLIISVTLLSLFAVLLGPRPALALVRVVQIRQQRWLHGDRLHHLARQRRDGQRPTDRHGHGHDQRFQLRGRQSPLFARRPSTCLTDFEAPYTFTLPTAGFANGGHTLSVSAVMRGTDSPPPRRRSP